MKTILIIAAILCCGTGAAVGQDIQKGEALFKRCLPCHAVGESAKRKFGPPLNGLDGRKIGTVAGYRFSDRYKDSEIIWDEVVFSTYVVDPKSVIANSKMAFVGVKNQNDARDLWVYISSFDNDGMKR
jgi:cytochrome c